MNSVEEAAAFTPKDARTGKPISLAMQRLWLVGRVMPVGARLLVRHVFRSGEKKPLEVIYGFGLPRDAALRRFRITGAGFSVASGLLPVDEAVKSYEQAIEDGNLAAMARQYGDGIVNLSVGNIRPGEEVTVHMEIVAGVEPRDDGFRFRFPFALAPAYHAGARAAEVSPGVGEIELPGGEFGDVILPQFVSEEAALHEVGFDLSVSMPEAIVETGSPSHAVRVVAGGPNRCRVSLAAAKDVPNRDLVLDVRTAGKLGGVIGGTAGDGRGYFATVVPSRAFEDKEEVQAASPKRVVFLVDRSGSMQGLPIEQAKRAVEACLGALGEADSFGLVAFDDSPEIFAGGLVEASRRNRDKARDFLAGIDARGGTDLAIGIQAAADMLSGGRSTLAGDILVVTDGQVMGTERIIELARGAGARLFCLGIGSASQDRFLASIARETGGVSRFLTPRERIDLGAVELFAAVGRPVASGVEARVDGFVEGRIAPEPAEFVFEGTPLVLFGDTEGAGEGGVVLGWASGDRRLVTSLPLVLGRGGEGETVRLLQGARLITDLENRLAGGEEKGLESREMDRVRTKLAALSQAYGLASRLMALVAVVERPGDRPGDVPMTKVVPVGLAQDLVPAAYFETMLHMDRGIRRSLLSVNACMMRKPSFGWGILGKLGHRAEDVEWGGPTLGMSPDGDVLIDLAASIEPDGGMPGKTEEERLQATVLALLRFLSDGQSVNDGVYKLHVRRLVEFLERSKHHREIITSIVEMARKGLSLAGDWAAKKPGPELWRDLEEALKA